MRGPQSTALVTAVSEFVQDDAQEKRRRRSPHREVNGLAEPERYCGNHSWSACR